MKKGVNCFAAGTAEIVGALLSAMAACVQRGGEREFKMHKAICTDCGDACEVPFRPTGDKPVLCKNCFVDKRDFNPSNFKQQTRRSDKPERTEAAPDRRIDDLKKELANVSAKLDAALEILNSLTAKKTTKSKAKKDAEESEAE
jgi:CxxC-x17-CxxC domain-containing protein